MRRISLSAAVLLALVTGPLSGCAHTGGLTATRSQKIEAKFDLARLAESDGQLDKAREGYEAIYKKDPSIAAVSHRLGLVNAKQSNYETAKRYLNEAHKLDPTNPEILNDLGYTCFLSGDSKMAETVFGTVLKISKDNKRATNNLAMVLGNEGRFDESYRLFRKVNSEAEAHSNVAYLYAQSGEGKKALEHYSRALTLNPELKNAATGMLEIATMQQKMEVDRAQIAQQQRPQNPVAQVAAENQPKVYQQLTAAAPVASPAQANPPVKAAAVPVIHAEVAKRVPAAAIEAISDAAPITEVAIARPAAQASKEEFAAEVEDVPSQVVPTSSRVTAARTAKSDAPVNQSHTAEEAFAGEDEKEIPDLQPVESTATAVRNQGRGVVPAPVPSADAPTLTSDFTEPTGEQATAIITPVSPAQAEASVPEIAVPQPKTTPPEDYAALCPHASDAVKPLLKQLNSHDGSQMKIALHKLGELGAAGKSAVPAVHSASKSGDAYVRIHAALALWRIEENSQESIPVFVDGLANTDANVRSFSATAMAMGPQANEFIVPLTMALSDGNPFVRLHSAETLYKFPGQETVATKAMLDHLSDKEANVRWLATFIMGETLPKSVEAVQALAQALNDSDHRVRTGAAFALGGLGRDAQVALPDLKRLSADQHPEVRKSAAEAIREIEQNSAQASTTR
jgi:Flp pilus assembly protein TadD/HEAT repeat protein